MKVKSILVNDDSRSIRKIVSTALRGAGYEVLEAENGEAGVEMAKGRELDLVLTDLNMPVLNGLGFTEKFRALPEHRETPVLVVTTESQLAKKEQAKAAGANGWIVKPIQPSRLIEVVEQVLAKSKG